jgi:hypothetical protein
VRSITFPVVVAVALPVVLLCRDVAVLHVFGLRQPGSFLSIDHAIRACSVFDPLDMLLARLQTLGLPGRELAGLYALFNALLLIELSLVEARGCGFCCRSWKNQQHKCQCRQL